MMRPVSMLSLAQAGFMSTVFLDSLRFKFTNHPNTQEIFGRLDGWAGSLGAPGLFAPMGLFSQYVIGGAELAATALLIVGALPRRGHLQAAGAALAAAIMTGAVSFHLFTPLGIDPNNDGGGLFMAACANLGMAVSMLAVFRRDEAAELLDRLLGLFAPMPAPAPAMPEAGS